MHGDRTLTPDRVAARRDGDDMQVEIAFDAMPAADVHLVAGNLCQVIGVPLVDTEHPAALCAVA